MATGASTPGKRWHPYPYTDSSLLQASIEFLGSSITVIQFLFVELASFFHKICNRLKARVVIYAYQHHVRLLLPNLWSSCNRSVRSREPTLLRNQVAASTTIFDDL
jgi:hypothetical protein